MMISPEAYYEENLKEKSAEQIMTVIRGLKNEIGHLKNILESPDYDMSEHLCPDEHTRLSCYREYLERAKLALIAAGGVYIPSKSELKSDKFDESIPSINKIVFSIGGFFNGRETRTITLDENHLYMNVEYSLRPESPKNFERDYPMIKAEFLVEFSKLHIGEWHERYVDIDALDGTQWGLDIYFSNNSRPVKIYGSNAYPYNFDELLDLLGIGEGQC